MLERPNTRRHSVADTRSRLSAIRAGPKQKGSDFSKPLFYVGRGSGIRTRDPLHPMQVRYQAALYPDGITNCFTGEFYVVFCYLLRYHHFSIKVATDGARDALRQTGQSPIGKDILKADGGGLYIRVSIHGTKTFLRKNEHGSTRYRTLGQYPLFISLGLPVRRRQLEGRQIVHRAVVCQNGVSSTHSCDQYG